MTFGQRSVSPSRRQQLACSLSDIEMMTIVSLAGQGEVQLVLVEVQTMSFTEGSGSCAHGEFGHGAYVTVKEMIGSGNNRHADLFHDGVI